MPQVPQRLRPQDEVEGATRPTLGSSSVACSNGVYLSAACTRHRSVLVLVTEHVIKTVHVSKLVLVTGFLLVTEFYRRGLIAN